MRVSEGSPEPVGLTFIDGKVNFSMLSQHAFEVFLAIFLPEKSVPELEIPLKRTGSAWHAALEEVPEGAEYAIRCLGDGPPTTALPFSPKRWLFDPYAKVPLTREKWNSREKLEPRVKLSPLPPFDWQGVAPPKIAMQDLIIYEMHVRGFTIHPSSQVSRPGTFAGIIEKIPYLKELGVNAVELMPIFEFDETHIKNVDPKTKEPLVNYWGYSPLHFFAPMRRFAFDAKDFGPIQEFKTMVRELHRNGIEVILDVVYNHTGESSDFINHFRGIDKPSYYMLDKDGKNKNYTGCGNTFNVNHPITKRLILDSLLFWINEMGVDGFRFDLASIFTRSEHGDLLDPSPLLLAIEADPIIRNVKLIAEAWDAAGLYQVGQFPKWGPWSEWNGKFRDITRRYLKGTEGKAGLFASVLTGSEFLYGYAKMPASSVNFITAHDGFTLRDLVTYQQKHNLDNGEENRDGANQNDNWNCGVEGPTQEGKISSLREMQMRNFLLALFISQGVPMLLMGDEYGHTRRGNNNAYVQDNELNWFLWDELEKNRKLFAFTKGLIHFRKNHANLRFPRYLTPNDIDWHGSEPLKANWDAHARFVAFTLKEPPPLYAAFNADYRPITITLPPNQKWKEIVRTDKDWGDHFLENEDKAPFLPASLELPPRSSLLAKAAL